MTELNHIIDEINNELLRLKIEKEYNYYARKFDKRAKCVIKRGGRPALTQKWSKQQKAKRRKNHD